MKILLTGTKSEAVLNILTHNRYKLLQVIKNKHPKNTRTLAKIVRRSFPSVLRDVELLKKHGLIKLSKTSRTRRSTFQPSVAYDAIQLSIAI